jgi:hypothetical protein
VKLLAGCRADELAKLEAATGMQKKILTYRCAEHAMGEGVCM